MAWKKFPECERCPLKGAPGPVFGDGDKTTAKFIYIAQNPAYVEVEQGVPLVGPIGRVFNRQLFEAGIRRTEIYVTNSVKCETPNNRPPTKLEVKCCRWILEKELAACKADMIVLAGDIPFEDWIGSYSTITREWHKDVVKSTYKPSSSVGERAGCVEVRDGRKWIGVPHPGRIARTPKLWQDSIDYLKKAYAIAGRKLEEPFVTIYPPDEYIYDVVIPKVLEIGAFADDVETADSIHVEEDDYVGGASHVTMCGISWSNRQAVVLSPQQIPLLSPIFSNPNLWRYEHNGPFDDYYIQQYVGPSTCKRFDTMLARHYLRSYTFKRLKPECIASYTFLPYYNRDLGHDVSMELYNGYDAMTTFETGQLQRRLLRTWKLEEVFFTYGQPLLPILEEWRRVGITTDVRRALMFMKVLETRIAKAYLLIAKLAGPTFNPNSHVQMKELLYEKWGLPQQHKKGRDRKTGAVSEKVTTDDEAKRKLKRWINQTEDRKRTYKLPLLFLDLSDYLVGEQAKLNVLNAIQPDGRLHAWFKAHGASSMRLASVPNVQNWRKDDVANWGTSSREKGLESPIPETLSVELGSLRSLIIPDHPEDYLLTIDFEQIEPFVYAVQAGVKWLLDIHAKGEYMYGELFEALHKSTDGRRFFQEGMPHTKHAMLPDISESELKHIKAVPLGFLYGRNAEAVAEEYNLPILEAEKLRNFWFKLCPELLDFYAKKEYEMWQTGMVRHVFGNIVWFPTKKVTEVRNTFGQSPSALILIGTIIQCHDEFKRRGYKNTRMVLSVHDSITFNIPGNHIQEVYTEVIHPIATRPIPELGGFQFRHSADVGKMLDWKDVPYAKWIEARRADRANNLETTGTFIK